MIFIKLTSMLIMGEHSVIRTDSDRVFQICGYFSIGV